MAATLRTSENGLKIVDSARKRKGWKVTAHAWCMAAHTSPATLKRFRQLKPIEQETFINICQAVGVNWEEVVDNDPPSPPSNKIEWYLVLTSTVEEVNRVRVEAILEALKPHLGNDLNLNLKKIERGSVVLVLESELEAFERLRYLFLTGEVTTILGIPIQNIQLQRNQRINWRQLLQNINELLDWQSPALVLAPSAHKGINPSDKTLQELVQIWETTQDEETRWEASLSIGKLDPNHPLAGIELGKIISLPTQPNPQSFALIAGFVPLPNEQVSIRIEIASTDDEQFYLPPHLKLTIIDDAGQPFIESESGDNDPYLAASFTGPREVQFSVTISLGNANITEYFLS